MTDRAGAVLAVLAIVVAGAVVPGVGLAADDGGTARSVASVAGTTTANVTGTVLRAEGSDSTNDMIFAFSTGDAGADVGNQTGPNGEIDVSGLTTGVEYEITYYQDYGDSEADYALRDGSPDVYALDRQIVENDVDLGTVQLPSASVLNVTVVDKSGSPVEGANVTVMHRNVTNGAEAGLYNSTAADGKYYLADTAGIEVAGNVTVEVTPPDDRKYVERTYTRNLTVTADGTVTVTLEERPLLTGQFEYPNGSAVTDRAVFVSDFTRSSAYWEGIQLSDAGAFSIHAPNGTYNLTVTPLIPDDGVTDSWTEKGFEVQGDTDVGMLRLPRGYNLTVDAVDHDDQEVDAYIEVREPYAGWIYEYASGTPLDGYWEGVSSQGWYNVSRREVSNGTYDVTVLDSWTRDVLGTKTVTVDGQAISSNVTVDRYNGTDLSGAVGPSIARDLPTDRTASTTLRGGLDDDVNVRLFLLNTTGGETVSVREELPAGYEYVPGSLVADGSSVSNVATGNGELAFDVDGGASEVRYRVRTTDGGRKIMAFGGSYTVGGTTNATLGDDVIDAGAPTLEFTKVSPTTHVSERNVLSIAFSVDDDTPSELALTVENASTGEVVYRRSYSVDGGSGFHLTSWDATDPNGNRVPSGDYVVRIASRADTGPGASVEQPISVDYTEPTVAVSAVNTSTSASAGPGATVYTNGTLGVDLTADGTPGEASAVEVFLLSRLSNFDAFYDATAGDSGAWSVVADLSGLPDDGTFDVEAGAVDPAGNAATNATGPTVVLDREAPELRVTVERVNDSAAMVSVNASEVLTATPQVAVERPDGTTPAVTMAANGTRRWTGVFNVTSDGQYNLTASGRDRAGNVATAEASADISTVDMQKDYVTVKMEPSGLFVRFDIDDGTSATNSFVTMTGSRTPLAPLVKGNAGVNFLNAKLGDALEGNLTNATIGIPVNESQLPNGVDPADVTIRYYDETNGTWERQDTTRGTVTLDDGTTGEYWLANVSHFSTYGAVATDEDDPTLASATPTGHLDEGTTDATVRFDYVDELSGVNASEVTLRLDGADVTDDAASSVTGEYAIHEATGLAAGDHTASVTVVDEAGNEVAFDTSFSVPEPAASDEEPADPSDGTADPGSAPASGGGGGGSLPPPSILVDVAPLADGGATVSLTGARPGETVRTDLSGVAAGGVSFTGLALDLAGDHGEFSLDLVPTGSASDAAPLPPESAALTYLRVDHGVDESVIGSAELRFAVDRSALPAGTTLDDVAVLRHHDGSWERIDTDRRGGRFTAETPGFSVFAVVVDRAPAEFEIGDVALGAGAVSAGEPVAVSATVTNPGAERRTREVALAVDGETVATKRVELAPGESKPVAFEYTPRAAGRYEVSVGGVPAGTLTVGSDAETTGTVRDDGTTTSSGQPGFGLPAGFVALLVAGLLGRRR